PDPTIVQSVPAPDFFFLWVYAALSFLPRDMETPLILTAPVLGVVLLFLVPFLSGFGEKSWRRRPVSVLTVLFVGTAWIALTGYGLPTPWSPKMEAWSGAPVPSLYLAARSPLERQGAVVLQNKQCRNCHALDGIGGERGPALDEVATHLTHDELIRQVLQGG